MANGALTKAEQNALAVSYEVLGTKVELDLDFVKNYLVRGDSSLVTDQEVVFFMNTCKMQKLNPLVQGEVYLIKYSKGDPAQMVVGKTAYLRRAFEHPDYICKEDGILVSSGDNCSVIKKEGCCVYPGEKLIGAWCKVHYLKNGSERTAYKEVSLSEYDKGQANWKSKPATMINKVAVSQCVREAFPKDYEGLYSEEEMISSGAIPTTGYTVDGETGEVIEGEIVEEEDPPITQEQRQMLFKTTREHFGKEEANALLKELLEKEGYESTEGLPSSVYKTIINEIVYRAAHKYEETPEQ